MKFSCKQFLNCYLNLHLKFGVILPQLTKIWHYTRTCTKTCVAICFRKPSVYWSNLYVRVCHSRKIMSVSLCLVPFYRRQIVISRKVWHFVVAYTWRKLWSYLHSYLNSPRMIELFDFRMQHLFARCYTQHDLRPSIDSEINHIRHFTKIQVVNKGIEFINLPSIFKDTSVISSIPTYFENKESPIICFKCKKPMQ